MPNSLALPLPSAGDHSTHTYTALVHPAATPTHTPGSVRVEHYIIHAGITFLGSQTGTTTRRWTPRGLHASPAKHPSDFFFYYYSLGIYIIILNCTFTGPVSSSFVFVHRSGRQLLRRPFVVRWTRVRARARTRRSPCSCIEYYYDGVRAEERLSGRSTDGRHRRHRRHAGGKELPL